MDIKDIKRLTMMWYSTTRLFYPLENPAYSQKLSGLIKLRLDDDQYRSNNQHQFVISEGPHAGMVHENVLHPILEEDGLKFKSLCIHGTSALRSSNVPLSWLKNYDVERMPSSFVAEITEA